MNGPPISPESHDGYDLDEALSALVDDELDAFAHDHGLTEEAVRARLVALPDFAARRAALQRTRASIREPVAFLDDVTRHRLVRNATDAASDVIAPEPRSRRWIAITAIAAAGLLLVAGVGVAVSSMGGSSSSSSSSSDSGASSPAPLRGDVGDLGDVTSPVALKELLDRRAAKSDTSSTALSPEQSQLSGGGASADATKRAAPPSPASTEKCARELAGTRAVVFTGTGTYQGAPVTIVGITSGDRTVVFVVSDTDCTNVVASISR
jgi:hypothetical protein